MVFCVVFDVPAGGSCPACEAFALRHPAPRLPRPFRHLSVAAAVRCPAPCHCSSPRRWPRRR
eukprot:1120417-Lingulodinium_polyedra.AAC.1